jgi:phosphomethylpyrimidine synthase
MNVTTKPATVTTGPIPGAQKVHSSPPGRPDIAVPFREVALHPTAREEPLRLYDTSGPYTDPAVTIDLAAGLPQPRAPWLARRGLVAIAPREVRPEDNGHAEGDRLVPRLPRRAPRPGRRRRPARHPIRIRPRRHHHRGDDLRRHRENLGRAEALASAAATIEDGESFGAEIPEFVTPEFVRKEIAARPRHHPGQHQPPGAGADDHRPQLPGQDQRQYRQLRRASSVAEEVEKLVWAIRWGADTVMDLSTGRNIHNIRDWIIRNSPGADRHRADLPGPGEGRRRRRGPDLGGLPRHPDRTGRAGRGLLHHPRRVPLAYVPLTAKRVTGIVSRGGSIMAKWCLAHHKESFLYEHFADICDIMRAYDVSSQPGRRPAPRQHRRRQRRRPVRRARNPGRTDQDRLGHGCQTMIEGPGHVPMHKIKDQHGQAAQVCGEAPFYTLGPLTTDIAPGYDHITQRHRRGHDRLVRHRDALLRHAQGTPGPAQPR